MANLEHLDILAKGESAWGKLSTLDIPMSIIFTEKETTKGKATSCRSRATR
jgi:hypothetical protein